MDLTIRDFESVVLKAQVRFLEWKQNHERSFNEPVYKDALKNILGSMDEYQRNAILQNNPQIRQALDQVLGGDNYAR